VKTALKCTLLLAAVCGLLFSLAGCTPYRSYRIGGLNQGLVRGGGYSDNQLAPDVFRIDFDGNAFTSWRRTQDFAMLRAADVVREHNFKYFAITSGGNNSYAGSTSIGPTYTQPSTGYPLFNPVSALTIRCFNEKPEGTYTFDAVYLQQALRKKYNIKPPETSPAPKPSKAEG
jgi:hypothetical protein